MDVKISFIHGDLTVEISMEQPLGFMIVSGLICRLNKSLYGLKQEPHPWYEKID